MCLQRPNAMRWHQPQDLSRPGWLKAEENLPLASRNVRSRPMGMRNRKQQASVTSKAGSWQRLSNRFHELCTVRCYISTNCCGFKLFGFKNLLLGSPAASWDLTCVLFYACFSVDFFHCSIFSSLLSPTDYISRGTDISLPKTLNHGVSLLVAAAAAR